MISTVTHGKHVYHNRQNDSYCSIGAIILGLGKDPTEYSCCDVVKELGIDHYIHTKVIMMNDGGTSWNDIADYLESEGF
jgi:hypothetical protein